MRNRILVWLICCWTPVLASPKQSPPVKLDFFSGIPKVIDGCVGIYTYDTTSLKKKKYILITNLQELALIRVSGKVISLHIVSQTDVSGVSHKDIYKGSGYTLVVRTKEGKPKGDEETYETGTIELTNGTKTITLSIHGTAGC